MSSRNGNKSVFLDSVTRSSSEHCLDLFKKKVDELVKLASRMPQNYKQDAEEYLFQSLDNISGLLDNKHKNENLKTGLPCENLTVLEKKDKKIIDDNLKKSLETVFQKEEVVSLDIISKDDESSSHEVVNYVQVNDTVKNNEHVEINTGSNNMETSDNSKSHIEIFIESTGTNKKQNESKDNCIDDETENLFESLDEAEAETADNSVTNRCNKDEFEDSSETKNILESGQPSESYITELLKCIPQLSQYIDVDPKNISIMKDDEKEDDKCLHVTVELSDGTVQKLKIAGYKPKMSRQNDSSVTTKDLEMKFDATQKEKEETRSEMANKSKEPSIMGRRLRERNKKAVIPRRPGRPKNEDIPAPETNEKGETFYRCEDCRATVKTYNALIVHMRTHTGSRPFRCSFCSKSFTTKGNMKAHEMTTHSDSKPWKCEYCDKCFKEKKVMKIHERIHTGEKPYRCSICEKAFTQRSVMLEHMLTHSNNKPHLCDFCGQGFRGLSSLKAHKKRHLGLREFQCDSCERAFVCKNELKRHLLTHTGDRPYSCEYCSKAFTRLSYLKEHINLHTGAKPYTCLECNLAFSDTMSLHRHKKKHIVNSEYRSLENEPSPVIFNGMEQSLMLEIPEQTTLNGEQTSIQVVVEENTSMEDFQKLHSLLLSATGNAELMMNSQETAKHLYQVLCVNPDTQEVVGQVEGQEVIVEGQGEDISSVNLQYNVH